MFEVDYRIIYSDYDDFAGQHGFFQIKCNDFLYGEVYPKEMEAKMDKVPLCDWFERLIKVAKNLLVKEYVVLSDVESYNTWIEFKRKKEKLIISIVKAEKQQNSQDIEFDLQDPESGEWENQMVDFNQFKEEIIEKGYDYLRDISGNNFENTSVKRLRKELMVLQRG